MWDGDAVPDPATTQRFKNKQVKDDQKNANKREDTY